MLTRKSIAAKSLCAFGALFAVTLVLGVASWNAIADLGRALEDTNTIAAAKVALAGQVGYSVAQMRAAQRGLLLAAALKEGAAANAAIADYDKAAGNADKAIAAIRPLLVTDRGRQLTSGMETAMSQWTPVFEKMAAECAAGRLDAAQRLRAMSLPLADELLRSTEDLLELQKTLLERSSVNARGTLARSRRVMISLLGLSALIGTAMLFGVRSLALVLRRVASELAGSAEEVASASGQISNSSQALAQCASEQSAGIEETSASTEELASMAHRNADQARLAAESAAETKGRVVEADRALAEMRTAMGEINGSSQEVARIIKVIDEIAFRTNILSLNAAVEAAHAGEAGLGFAVVADEVRKLAERSAQAAKETASLISDSIDKTRTGKERVEVVEAAMRVIMEDAGRIRESVEEIKLGSEEQDTSFGQISKALAEMERITQQNAAGAEEGACAAEEMASQAQAMRDAVSRLLALVGGRATARVTRSVQLALPSGEWKRKPAVSGSFDAARSLPARAAFVSF